MPCFRRLVSFVLKIVPECSSGSNLFGEGRVKDSIFRFTYVSLGTHLFLSDAGRFCSGQSNRKLLVLTLSSSSILMLSIFWNFDIL
jgi:hypothetical protein